MSVCQGILVTEEFDHVLWLKLDGSKVVILEW